MSKYKLVEEFNRKIIKLAQLANPTDLDEDRVAWFMTTVLEELEEFKEAWRADDKVGMMDALVDMTYFILGRVYECGFSETQWDICFDAVHNCNMTKKRGNKGRGSDADAIKDETWVGPEAKISAILDTDADFKELEPLNVPVPNVDHRKPGVYIERDGEQFIISGEDLEIFSKMSPVFKEVAEIAIKKSQDYNNGNGTPTSRAVYFPFGLLSYAQMLHTKSQRLNSLAQQNKAPNNESIRDTLLDMINYASFAVEAIDKGEI